MFKINVHLPASKVHSKVLLADRVLNDVKSVINGIVDFKKVVLHVGSIGAIMVDVEDEMVKRAEQLEEDVEKLSMSWDLYGIVDDVEGDVNNLKECLI